jgi:ATP-dependent helicase Lhr and Lhr-like helicase
LRALATDIARAMEEVIAELGMQWKIGIRHGDTEISERAKQKRQMPEVLIITPESMHLLMAMKNNDEFFKPLKIVAVDEWHELLGSKRGVQTELAVSYLCYIKKQQQSHLQVWGISATIGNLLQAKDVLLMPVEIFFNEKTSIVKANLNKQIKLQSIIPDEIENYPWAGHLGIKLAHHIVDIINQNNSTLIFINTRGMCETWYQTLLTIAPELAGAIALHHGSIEKELRTWVEEALHLRKLKAVVCTASLDLGVDFRPVDAVVQVGSPKGVARFLQRAGRAGHQPGAVSSIYFLPTHSLELLEGAALKNAMNDNNIESRNPMLLCYDVLIQFLCTLAVGNGFSPTELLPVVVNTFCFNNITHSDWQQALQFITTGGIALNKYDEFKKVSIEHSGIYKIINRRIAMRHRMHIGTIVSNAMIKVRMLNGGYIGVIEEYFISRLEPGTVFTLAGRNLELVQVKDMTAFVRKTNSKKSLVPSWQGGRMPLSANLGKLLRHTLNIASKNVEKPTANLQIELKALMPLFKLQNKLSALPKENELLIELINTEDGFHLFCYPFEGRLVHEALASILAFRISLLTPISFSIAMNDYGFELLSDQQIPITNENIKALFSLENLTAHIQRSVNSTEMAQRKFRDIAVIGGLIFTGYPGEQKKQRHLQSSASLLFKVFNEYEKQNILIQQAYQEIYDQQLEEQRLRNLLERIHKGKILITNPQTLTPFCFPIKVDSMRESLTSEKLEERIKRMKGI